MQQIYCQILIHHNLFEMNSGKLNFKITPFQASSGILSSYTPTMSEKVRAAVLLLNKCPSFYGTHEIHACIHKKQSLVPNQTNPVSTLQPYLFKSYFNVILKTDLPALLKISKIFLHAWKFKFLSEHMFKHEI